MIHEVEQIKEKGNKFWEIIERLLKIIGTLSILFYILGFLVWNIYLNGLRFSEIELLQTRFILTGSLFSANFVFWLIVGHKIIKVFRKFLGSKIDLKLKDFILNKKWDKAVLIYFLLVFFVFYLFYFSILRFPTFPRIIGGAEPSLTSILTSEDGSVSQEYLKKFGINSASNVQSQQVCVAYENSDSILIVLPDRELQLSKSSFVGQAPIPTSIYREVEKNYCKPLVGSWLMLGNGLDKFTISSFIFRIFYGF